MFYYVSVFLHNSQRTLQNGCLCCDHTEAPINFWSVILIFDSINPVGFKEQSYFTWRKQHKYKMLQGQWWDSWSKQEVSNVNKVTLWMWQLHKSKLWHNLSWSCHVIKRCLFQQIFTLSDFKLKFTQTTK